MKIIANVTFSEQLKVGDSYELPESDGKMLIAAGLARAADDPTPAQTPDPIQQPSARAARARQYVRRDLQATT